MTTLERLMTLEEGTYITAYMKSGRSFELILLGVSDGVVIADIAPESSEDVQMRAHLVGSQIEGFALIGGQA